MRTKEKLGFLKKEKRDTSIKAIVQNYFILTSFKALEKKFNFKNSFFPSAVSPDYFFFSENSYSFFNEFKEEVVLKKAYRKNGFKKLIDESVNAFKSFDRDYEEYADFLKALEQKEIALSVLHLIDRGVMEIDKFVPFIDFLKLTTPAISLNNEEKLRLYEEVEELSDYELGVNYGWLFYDELKVRGYEKTGAVIRKKAKEIDVQRIVENKKRNEEFIENYHYPSVKARNLVDNFRLVRYWDCGYYKFIFNGIYKGAKARIREEKKLGLESRDLFYLMGYEEVNKKKIDQRKKAKSYFIFNEGNGIELVLED